MLHNRLETHVTELRERHGSGSVPRRPSNSYFRRRCAERYRGNAFSSPDGQLFGRHGLRNGNADPRGGDPIAVKLPPDAWRARLNMPDVTPEQIADEARRRLRESLPGQPISGVSTASPAYSSAAMKRRPAPVGYVVLVGGERARR
jgi:hypothetical protein